MQCWNCIRPFGGNLKANVAPGEADVVPGEDEFDSTAVGDGGGHGHTEAGDTQEALRKCCSLSLEATDA